MSFVENKTVCYTQWWIYYCETTRKKNINDITNNQVAYLLKKIIPCNSAYAIQSRINETKARKELKERLMFVHYLFYW